MALAERYVQTKNLVKIEFSRRGAWPTAMKFLGSMQHLWPLISHPGLLGSESNERRYFTETAETTPTFRKVNA